MLTNGGRVIIIIVAGFPREEKRECAGTGRQARLRGVCQQTYGFKSRHSHHFPSAIRKVNRRARVVELADSLDSGSSAQYGRAGSSPASRTRNRQVSTRSLSIPFCRFFIQRIFSSTHDSIEQRVIQFCEKFSWLLHINVQPSFMWDLCIEGCYSLLFIGRSLHDRGKL